MPRSALTGPVRAATRLVTVDADNGSRRGGNRSDGYRAVIYLDRSNVDEGRWEELKAGIRELVAFVEAHQPQMATYGFYLDEGTNHMTVVSVHPDSASLERHIEIGGPEFRKLAPLLALREIEVFGRLSERAVELVREKAATLGDQGVVRVHRHEQFAGFDRVKVPSDQ